jgi:2,4-didehydro-3-deoxy-L-rhamnonate hydrolase
MKLIRYGTINNEKPGICINNLYYDVSAFFHDYNEHFFANEGILQLEQVVANKLNELPQLANNIRLGCPVARPSKIVCTGLNYIDHAHEMNLPLPTEPIVFLKATSAIVGPYDAIKIPKNSIKTDWEVELAIVIGKRASYVAEAEALDFVAGYCLHNDVSERHFQLERGGTWDKGKGCDTFAPLGPWLATKNEVPNIAEANIWLKLNGEIKQQSNTSNLIFKVPKIISYISQFMTLLPGDIISTGTPAGVGVGYKPPIFLKAGDKVELGIDGLGISSQLCENF